MAVGYNVVEHIYSVAATMWCGVTWVKRFTALQRVSRS